MQRLELGNEVGGEGGSVPVPSGKNEEVRLEGGIQTGGTGHPGMRIQAPGRYPHVVGSTKLQYKEKNGERHSTAWRAGGIKGAAHRLQRSKEGRRGYTIGNTARSPRVLARVTPHRDQGESLVPLYTRESVSVLLLSTLS